MSSQPPLIAAVVPVFNRRETTRRFVEAFRRLTYERKMVVICDDGSTDGTGEFLASQPDVVTVKGDGSLWWSGGTNASIREALRRNADYILTINDDAIFAPDYLDRMAKAAGEFPGGIMANQQVQYQYPDHCWSLGASYINYAFHLYALDGYGAKLSYLQMLLTPCIRVETAPGNGVLYPAPVFQKVGLFDEEWTPHYHGDSLFMQRAVAAGVTARCTLHASLRNDISHHRIAKPVDPLLSIKSDRYAPSLYKSIEEREGVEKALDLLGDLVCTLPGEFCPEAKKLWPARREKSSPWRFLPDLHLIHTFSGGAFSRLGYHASAGLSVEKEYLESHIKYDLRGIGILSLALRVHRPGSAYLFVTSTRPFKHLNLLMDHQFRGETSAGEGWVTWFVISLEVAEAVMIPLAIVNHGVECHGIFVVAEQNVAPEFRDRSASPDRACGVAKP